MSPSGKNKLGRPEEEANPSPAQQEFTNLLQRFDYAFKRDDIVKGIVVSYESNGALIDIGSKTAAYISLKELSYPPPASLSEALTIGEEYEFFILRNEDEEGQFQLSRKRVFQAQTWQRLEEMMNNDAVVECTVSSIVKGGLLVDVMGLRGFVPSSHLRVRDSYESLLTQKLPLKILSLEQQNNNIILSHRKVVAEQMAEQRSKLFGNLTVGDIIEGDVVRLTEFGAFVDLGGVDGLLPLSQMSWRWVEHPADILKVGEKVKVEVIGIDTDKQRVSLSIKSQFNDPWVEVSNQIKLGDDVEGTITRLKHFGAFVEVFPGVEALLPSKDLMEHEQKQGKKLEPGEKIHVFVVKFHPQERRISLSFTPLTMESPQNDFPPRSMASTD